MTRIHSLKATVTGYKAAPPAERAGFGMLSACAVTIGVARAITYRIERDRNAPRLRSWARRSYQAVDVDGLRVHTSCPESRFPRGRRGWNPDAHR